MARVPFSCRVPEEDAVMAVKTEELHYPAANGTDTLSAQVWYEDGAKPKWILQIVHGMCEYMGRYQDFAEFMAQHGAVVCGNDHAGHGRSKGSDGYGYFAKKDGDKNLVTDARVLNRTICKRWPGLPVVMLGHSMGSFICRRYITQYGEELAGVILSGTAGGNPLSGAALLLAKAVRLFRGDKYRSPTLTKLAFGSYNDRYPQARTPYDWISRDTAVVDRYAADEACTYQFTVGAYIDLLRLLRSVSGDRWAKQAPTDRPYLVLSGSMDPVGNYTKGVSEVCGRLKRARVKDLTLKIYEGAHHEVLNETNHQEVYRDILDWTARALSSGEKPEAAKS